MPLDLTSTVKRRTRLRMDEGRAFFEVLLPLWGLVAHQVTRLSYYRCVILVLAVFMNIRHPRCEPTQFTRKTNIPRFVSKLHRQGGDTVAGT